MYFTKFSYDKKILKFIYIAGACKFLGDESIVQGYYPRIYSKPTNSQHMIFFFYHP